MLDMCPFKQEDRAVVFLVYYSCTFSFLPVNPVVSFVCSVAPFTSLILLLSLHSAQWDFIWVIPKAVPFRCFLRWAMHLKMKLLNRYRVPGCELKLKARLGRGSRGARRAGQG